MPIPPGMGVSGSANPPSMRAGWWLRKFSVQVTPVFVDVQGAGGVEEVPPEFVSGGPRLAASEVTATQVIARPSRSSPPGCAAVRSSASSSPRRRRLIDSHLLGLMLRRPQYETRLVTVKCAVQPLGVRSPGGHLL